MEKLVIHISSLLIPDYAYDVYDSDADEFTYDHDMYAVIRQLRLLHSFMVDDLMQAYEILYIDGLPKYTINIALNAYFTPGWMMWARKHTPVFLESAAEISRAVANSEPRIRAHVQDNIAFLDQTISAAVEFFIRELLEAALSIENTYLDCITLRRAAEREPRCDRFFKKNGIYLYAQNCFLCHAEVPEDTISEHALEILGVYADILVEDELNSKACLWHLNLNFE